jgi:hypothetical protein
MESMTLTKGMKSEVRKEFSPAPRYYRQGDYLNYFVSSKRCYARRVNSLLTIYTEIDTGELVGCKVKGIRLLMETLQSFGVVVTDGKTTMGLLFMSLLIADPQAKKEDVELVKKKFGDAKVDPSEFRSAI